MSWKNKEAERARLPARQSFHQPSRHMRSRCHAGEVKMAFASASFVVDDQAASGIWIEARQA